MADITITILVPPTRVVNGSIKYGLQIRVICLKARTVVLYLQYPCLIFCFFTKNVIGTYVGICVSFPFVETPSHIFFFFLILGFGLAVVTPIFDDAKRALSGYSV